MSNSSSRVRFAIFIAVLLVLGFYSIAQSGALSSVVGQPDARQAPAQEPAAQQAPAQQMGVPSGAVMFFNLTTCPNGWTELSAAQGRVIVGLHADSELSLGATVGTPLADKEDRVVVGKHTHSVNNPEHGHAVTDNGHTHSGKTSLDRISILISDQGHHHTIQMDKEGGEGNLTDGTDKGSDHTVGNTDTAYAKIQVWQDPHRHSLIVDTARANISVNPTATNVSVNPAGTITGTNAPYIQLLACQKN